MFPVRGLHHVRPTLEKVVKLCPLILRNCSYHEGTAAFISSTIVLDFNKHVYIVDCAICFTSISLTILPNNIKEILFPRTVTVSNQLFCWSTFILANNINKLFQEENLSIFILAKPRFYLLKRRSIFVVIMKLLFTVRCRTIRNLEVPVSCP